MSVAPSRGYTKKKTPLTSYPLSSRRRVYPAVELTPLVLVASRASNQSRFPLPRCRSFPPPSTLHRRASPDGGGALADLSSPWISIPIRKPMHPAIPPCTGSLYSFSASSVPLFSATERLEPWVVLQPVSWAYRCVVCPYFVWLTGLFSPSIVAFGRPPPFPIPLHGPYASSAWTPVGLER